MGLIEAFLDAALVAGLLAAAVGIGLPAAARLSPDAPGERALFAGGIGLLALGLATFLLGLLGLLYFPVILGLWAAGWAFAWRGRARLLPPDFGFWSGLMRPRRFFALFLASAGFNLLFSHSPPIMDDSVYIYLALPQAYAAGHSVMEVPENAHAYFPAVIEMLYTQLMLARPAEAAKLLNWAFGVLSALVAARLAFRHLGAERPGLTAALVYCMPWIASLSGSGKIDLGSMLFALLAAHALLFWLESPEGRQSDRLFTLCGLMAGAHFATKYTGLAAVAALFLWALPRLLRERRWRPALLFAACAAAPASPWLMRNWVLIGNPVFPASLPGHPGDPYLYAFFHNQAASGWTDYLLKTYNELLFGDLIWGTGPLIWALAPAVLLGWKLERDGRTARALALGGTMAVVTTAILPGAPLTRFLAPGLVLMAAACGAWIDHRWDRAALWLRHVLLATTLFPGVAMSAWFAAKRLPLWLGMETREAFVRRNWNLLEDYIVHGFIRNEVPPGSRILFTYLNVAPAYFYPEHRAMGLGFYPPSFYERGLDEAFRTLKSDGVRYLVTAPKDCVFEPDGTCTLRVLGVRLTWLRQAQAQGRLRLLVHGDSSALYEIP